jgi:2-polyprenyl-6-methoxyphenol hydroxylase-like FAD-dependent oxidoreductase
VTNTAARETDTQVVIAGAGPVGLLLACELRRACVPVVIVERLATPMTESRASQLTTLTAELLHERGFDALLDEAVPEPRAHFGGLPFDLSGLDSDYVGNWKVPQYRTESVLGERAERLGATLLRAHELIGVTADEDHVVCTVRGPAEELPIRARYLVGCDGGGSTVRRLGGFTSSVTPATKELVRADVTGVDIRSRRFERLQDGFAVAGTAGGVTRVMVHAPGQGVSERSGPPDFSEVVRLWEKVTGEDISAGKAIWVDVFDNSRGQVDEYRRGRVLLAGDAAHWHMPIGGQSINVGLQDAVNLGWKLAAVVNGWAPARLLDTYHEERHAVGARVLSYVAAQENLLLGGGEVEPLRAVLAELIGLDQVRGHLARVVSGLDDRYGLADSPLTGRRLSNVKLRDQAGSLVTADVLTGTEPVIVRFSLPENGASGAGDTAPLPGGLRARTVHAIPDGADLFPEVSTILVRPDGYIAWSGSDDAELAEAIEQWFGASAMART